MVLRNIFLLNLLVSLIMSQEQLGSDIDSEAAGDQFGVSVSLDSDGDRVAIGGLGWLAALGGALAYKKLRKK